MSSISFDNISIKGLSDIQHILNISIVERTNEHSRACIEVLMEPNRSDIGRISGLHNVVILEKATNIILFNGYIESIRVVVNNGLNKAVINLLSFSAQLEYKLKSRSFQKANCTYQQIADQIAADYVGASILFHEQASTTIGCPIIQYEETDWEFLKRLASRFHMSLIPDSTSDKPCLNIGVEGGSSFV